MPEFFLGVGITLVVGGAIALVYSMRELGLLNYKPRHTRSTYLPPKR
jgi:hypothetical protein